MLKLPIYLDHNATTPCDPQVMEVMLPYFTELYGNAASRSHSFGWQAEEAVDYAREQVAKLIGAEPKEIIFTSGATEGDNLAIKGVFEMYAGKGNHILTCVTEHKAVLDTCKHIEKLGGEVTYLPVGKEGIIDLQQLEAAITPRTILIAIMYANNETGTIQPVKEIGALAKKHGVLFFTDATQAVGKVPVDVIKDEIDLLTCSAHKMYGPKGVGALYVRRKNPRVRLTAQLDGGGHEKGMRSGTLNVPGIAGFGKAADLCRHNLEAEGKRLGQLRNKLESALLQLDATYLNGSSTSRLPHVTNISFNFVNGDGLMMGLNKEVALSSGAACTSASMEPSYVLKALGVADDLAHSSLRFSIGRYTTEEEIDFIIRKVTDVVLQLRAMSQIG
ncbi:IscS subfamily cysteine desulfurase [Niastella populi]|uniref:Cysteine desulfurase IscS n=1 Tax=Niastella populi TaxID=550983 RepID=A0A1V9FK46_9BACT|nr:IscS subfamily cysteine desulfurase [Niastella populi]OQP58651.1 IscS subfamily cysteine desulfurase [Niastella populi]